MKKDDIKQLSFDFDNNEIQSLEEIENKNKVALKEKKQQQKEQDAKIKELKSARIQLKDNCKILLKYLDGEYDVNNIKVDDDSDKSSESSESLDDEVDEDE